MYIILLPTTTKLLCSNLPYPFKKFHSTLSHSVKLSNWLTVPSGNCMVSALNAVKVAHLFVIKYLLQSSNGSKSNFPKRGKVAKIQVQRDTKWLHLKVLLFPLPTLSIQCVYIHTYTSYIQFHRRVRRDSPRLSISSRRRRSFTVSTFSSVSSVALISRFECNGSQSVVMAKVLVGCAEK